MTFFKKISRFSQNLIKSNFKKLEEGVDSDFIVDPYNVVNKSRKNKFERNKAIILGGKAIDYDKLLKYFGCSKITSDLLERFFL